MGDKRSGGGAGSRPRSIGIPSGFGAPSSPAAGSAGEEVVTRDGGLTHQGSRACDVPCSSTSEVPSNERREQLRQTNLRLHERVDSFGRPQQRGSRRTVKRQLIPAVEQGVTEPRELTLDEASREKAEAAERAEGVVVAQCYQRAEVAEAEGRARRGP